MKKYVLCACLVVLLYALPAFFNHYLINESFLSNRFWDNWWNLLRIAKITTYSLFFPSIFLLAVYLVRHRTFVLAALSFISSFIYIVLSLLTLNYYQYFGDLIHYEKISDAKNLFEVRDQIIYQIVDPLDLFLLVIIPVGTSLIVLLFRYHNFIPAKAAKTLPAFCLMILTLNAMLWSSQILRHGSPIRKLNVQGEVMTASHYGFATAYISMALATQEVFTEIPYPGTINNHLTYRNVKRLEKQNVVFVQIESLDARTIDLQIHQNDVMPFLRSLKKRAIYFENFFSHHNGGGSSDADLAVLMSLIPIGSHSGLKTAQYEKVDNLINRLKENSYITGVFHSNKGQFYNRAYAYSKLGIDHFVDANEFTGLASGWYAKDKAFYEQSISLIKTFPKNSPFFAYLISIQSHGPFRNYDQETPNVLNIGSSIDPLTRDYLLTMHEVDEAIGHLFQLLTANGWDDNTLVIIFADHPSGVLKESSHKEHIPLLIWHKELVPYLERQPGSLIDIAPTVSHFLGLRPGNTWIGNSLLSLGNREVIFRDRTIIQGGGRDQLHVERDTSARRRRFIDYSSYLLRGH